MARQYPRFLYSNPKNTKSEGPFLIHMLPPRKLWRIEWQFSSLDFNLHEIETWGDEYSNHAEYIKIHRAAVDWLTSQLMTKAIKKYE